MNGLAAILVISSNTVVILQMKKEANKYVLKITRSFTFIRLRAFASHTKYLSNYTVAFLRKILLYVLNIEFT